MSTPDPLAESASPFLRHGADQPVNWLPWGEEAFRKAREQDRPILLDIGAVWCHWCHVMDRESYEDEETAALINELYVPVKVDRDERPDVDARYQRAVQAISGQGGWPLTAFLTSDGVAFHGGTYFPPEPTHGRPSFRTVLREIARVWAEERDKATEVAGAVEARVHAVLTAEAGAGDTDPGLVESVVDELARAYDARHGGFGSAPKFPNVGGLGLLLDHGLDTGSELSSGMVEATLSAMSAGGIHDHLGGGFHRYSTDARWIIPHFEKMAYDNGPLLELLARADAALDADFRRVVRGVVDYYRDVAPELLEAGGFPASQDADIGFEDDGDYWTWTEGEVRDAVSSDGAAEAAILRWGVRDSGGSMHLTPERHVLFEAMSVEEVARAVDRPEDEVAADLDGAREELVAARSDRPRPYVDTTLYAGWVSLVASGHIAAERHAEVEGAAATGLRALDRVWAEGWTPDRGIAHRLGDDDGVEQLGDQAYFAAAALDAFEWTQDPEWLDRARSVLDLVLERFRHESGGLTDRPAGAAGEVGLLEAGRLEITDTPEPSPTAVTAIALARLGGLDHDAARTGAAEALLGAYAGSAPRFGGSAATYARAVRWVTRPVTTVVVIEEGDGNGLTRAALRPYRPGTVVRRYSPDAVDPDALPEAVAAMITGDAPRAYICVGTTCAPPAKTPEEVGKTLAEFSG